MSHAWKKTSLTFLALLLAFSYLLAAAAQTAHAAGELTLYTRNKSITVAPGESISYSIDVINNTASIQNARLYVQGLPEGWEYDLTSGAYQINELSVKGEETQSVSLSVDVPLQVEKGEYSFSVIADGITALPLTIVVSETGTFKTELTTKQPNMQGDADASFSFQLDLSNRTAEEQTYSLTADTEQGWKVTFRVSGNNVTSATVEADSSQTVYVDIDPPENVSDDGGDDAGSRHYRNVRHGADDAERASQRGADRGQKHESGTRGQKYRQRAAGRRNAGLQRPDRVGSGV